MNHKEGVDLIPANIELSAIEVSLVNAMSRELIMRSLVERLREFYDFIIIDCMPSLGMMTINALACADSVLIPVQAAYLPVKGLQQLIKTIGRVKKQLNPKLRIEGILLTMVDNRTNYARDISLMVYDTYSASIKVFATGIPMSVRASEVSVEGGSIYSYDPKGKAAFAYGQWKDTGIRLEGDAVQSLTVTFLEMWNAVSEKATNDTDFSKYIIHYDYKAQQTGFVQPYADSPMDNEQVGEEVYISMINKAEKYCWFMTPYLIITDEMTHALCLAAKRGVDVRIITPGIPDKKFIYNITRSFYHGLVKHGVRVYEWTPGFCHAKMSIVDDCMATCGTINLDYRSLYHHFENGCFMADCQAVVEIKNDLIRTMGECRDVTDQYCTGRSAYLRLGQLFMRLFAGLL